MFKLFAILVFVPAIFARTPVRQCTRPDVAGARLPDAVHFGSRENPCLAAPCQISRGGGAGITYVDFTVPTSTQRIMPRVRALVFGSVTITQELPESIRLNPCGILIDGHSCPLEAGEQPSYRLELPVDPLTPLIDTDTEITLHGDNNEVIFCYQLATTLVP